MQRHRVVHLLPASRVLLQVGVERRQAALLEAAEQAAVRDIPLHPLRAALAIAVVPRERAAHRLARREAVLRRTLQLLSLIHI